MFLKGILLQDPVPPTFENILKVCGNLMLDRPRQELYMKQIKYRFDSTGCFAVVADVGVFSPVPNLRVIFFFYAVLLTITFSV